MKKPNKSQPLTLLIVCIAALTAAFACFIPSLVLAVRDNNTFILSIVIPAMLVLLVVEGIVISKLRKVQGVDSKR